MASNTLGTILIELKAKTDAFERGMKSAKDLSFTTSSEIVGSLERIGKSLLNLKFNNLDQMGRSLGMIGGIAAATGIALATSVVAVAVETSKKMVEMGHDAEKAGMGIQTFTEFAYAAKRSGVDIETFTNLMSKLAKTAVGAAQGNAQLQAALRLAGTSATDSAGRLRPTGDILTDIIKKYDTLGDKTLKVGLAMQVFGKSGAAGVPFLDQGPEKIEALRKQADQLGVAFGPELIGAAQSFVGSIKTMQAASEGAAIQFTSGFLPAVNQVLSSMLKVEGHASAMRGFGETAGEAFKFIAKGAMAAVTGVEEFILANRTMIEQARQQAANSSFFEKITGQAAIKAIFTVDPKTAKDMDDLQRRYEKFVQELDSPPKVNPHPEEKGAVGSLGLNPEKNNYAAEEIAKMREKAQANLALAAAQLVGEQSVRATSAANAADAVILQIATKASKEHKTALDAEIAAAQKKYGATVLTLTTLEQEASRQQSFNKSLKDQALDLQISADSHKRMADAIMQGGDALNEASIANQIDQLVRKADIQLTQDQIAALNKLKDAKRADADAAISEAINQETFSLQNAAKATQLLINAQNNGVEAEIRARAALEADNFERQHNTTLTIEQRKALEELYITQGRKQVAQQTGTAIQSQYNPTGERQKREEEIALAVKNGAITVEQAEAAKRDAYRREAEELDNLAMRTQKSSAGARVFLNEMARNARDMAQQTHDAFAHVWDGFDQGFRNAFRNVLMGTRTLAQGFRDLGVSILSSMIEAFAGMLARWIETHLIMGAINLIFHTQQTAQEATALGTKVALNSAANTVMAISDAGLAAAGAFAYYSATAPEAALPLAMAQYAEGLSLAGLAAFDYGGIMPNTGLALVHQNEGVLTGPTTKMLVNVNKMVNSMDTGRLAAAGAAGGSSSMPFAPTFHIYGATDADAVADKVMSRVKRHFRTAGVSR
jgi:hypothetical protein